jgi:hypothetical protein
MLKLKQNFKDSQLLGIIKGESEGKAGTTNFISRGNCFKRNYKILKLFLNKCNNCRSKLSFCDKNKKDHSPTYFPPPVTQFL